MHAFEVLADPVRRRLLELLAAGERSSGELVAAIQAEVAISQPGVSQHLRVLREHGFATVRADGTRRIYALDPAGLQAADRWLAPFRGFWAQRLDALGTEIARGKRTPADRGRAEEGQAAPRGRVPGPNRRRGAAAG